MQFSHMYSSNRELFQNWILVRVVPTPPQVAHSMLTHRDVTG